jgi:hypothetical protein
LFQEEALRFDPPIDPFAECGENRKRMQLQNFALTLLYESSADSFRFNEIRNDDRGGKAAESCGLGIDAP